MTVTGMSGLLTMTCDGVSSCAQASITGGSSLTTVICEQTSACQAATISSGTGWLNLTCGAAITDPCYSVIVKQQGGGALSETIASGAYLNFSCLPGQWQCSSNTSAQNNCLTDPRQCSQFASDAALIAFWKGLSSTGSLLWNTYLPLCGQTGVVCNGDDIISLYFPPALSSFFFLPSCQFLLLDRTVNQEGLVGTIATELGSLVTLTLL